MKRSESIVELTKSLCVVQGKLRGAEKSAKNSHLNSDYADLASIYEACRDLLAENDFAVIQTHSEENGKFGLETMLSHASGEWCSGFIPLSLSGRGGNEMQALGSATTYARRYGLAAMVGVAPKDDDGEAAGHRETARDENYRQPPQRNGNGNAEQREPQSAPAERENFNEMIRRFADSTNGTVNEFQLINALTTRAIEAGVIAATDVESSGKRDATKSRRALGKLYTDKPGRVRKSAEQYLETKLNGAPAQNVDE